MISEQTRSKALAALEGMRTIVRAEMLTQGVYIDDEVSAPRRTGAICGGRKHCAIGSLYAGAGIRPVVDYEDDEYTSVHLPGVGESERAKFMRNRPGLRVAYKALNDAATDFAERHYLDLAGEDCFKAAIEGLFEGHYGDGLTKRDMLKVIAAAKRRVKAA